jgi:perosamine synthetase
MTDNDELAKKCRLLINHGMDVKYYHDIIGYNYRMRNIVGAIGLCQLSRLPAMNAKRRKAALYYDDKINNELIITPAHDKGHVYHQYTLKVKDGLRNTFLNHLSNNEIGYGVFYPLTIPNQKCYASFDLNKTYPSADLLTEQVVSIPVHPSLTDKEIKAVAEAVNSFNGL